VDGVGLIFTFLAPATGLMLIYLVQVWIHLSIGRADRLFRWGIVEFTMISLLFVLGLRWVRWGSRRRGSRISASSRFLRCGMPGGRRASASPRSSTRSGSTFSLGAGRRRIRGDHPGTPSFHWASDPVAALMRIVMVSIVFATLYLCAVILFHRGFEPIRHVTKLLRDMAGPAPSSRCRKLRGLRSTVVMRPHPAILTCSLILVLLAGPRC